MYKKIDYFIVNFSTNKIWLVAKIGKIILLRVKK